MLAFIRTSEWETPLFLHVLGAMVLVGGMFVVALALVVAWRSEGGDAITMRRFAYRTLLYVVLPSFIAMRIGAQWTLSESPFGDLPTDPNWVGVGYLAADLGGLGLLVILVLSAVALRRADGGEGRLSARLPARLTTTLSAQIVTVVTLGLLAAYVLAIWAMTTKPT